MTGVKGTAFTAKYINRFYEMESQLRVPQTTAGQIQLLAKGHTELAEKVDSIDKDLQNFKQELPLLAIDCQKITKAKNIKVVDLLGGVHSNAYKDRGLRSKVYRDLERQLNREFDVTSYKAIKRNQVDKAVEIINNYTLPLFLLENIEVENAQMRIG
jgi:hypothetical protein